MEFCDSLNEACSRFRREIDTCLTLVRSKTVYLCQAKWTRFTHANLRSELNSCTISFVYSVPIDHTTAKPLHADFSISQVNANGKVELVNGWTTASWTTRRRSLTFLSSRSGTSGTGREPNQCWTTSSWDATRKSSMCTRFMTKGEVRKFFRVPYPNGKTTPYY